MADSYYQDYHNAFISRINNIHHRKNYRGLVRQRGLELSGQWIIDYSINENGWYSFSETTSLRLESLMIYDWLIWSSYTHYILCRISFILWNNKFEFGKYDDIWLITMIFLISLHSLQDIRHSIKQKSSLYRVAW